MLKTRVIPCLLFQNLGLVKTIKFKSPKYVGDPINAVKIFNEKEVDELVFLDIKATLEKRRPNLALISNIAGECFMPFGYGGGIRDLEDIKEIFRLGAEKAIINSYAVENPSFIQNASDRFGNQSIVISIDVKKSILGKYEVITHGGRKNAKLDPVQHATHMANLGAGEIIICSIDREGTQEGYDIGLIKKITEAIDVPVIALGGAGKLSDLRDAVRNGGASAVAAGSLFVFHGRHRAVLINYPSPQELAETFQ